MNPASTHNSQGLFERAKRVLPGGVSYAIRYFEPYPIYAHHGKGSRIWDVDGNEYTDYWMGHGAIIMGHAYPPVLEAAREQLELGSHLGYCHEWEVKLAEQLCRMLPSAQMVRFTNSGTEANMYAIRLARSYTGRDKIGKFEGHWHGGYDALHKGVYYPFDKPCSLGLTQGTLQDTLLLPYNNLEGVKERLKGQNLAGIVVEPFVGGGGFIPPEPGFLDGLKSLCQEQGALLIFDEVITGFRLSPGGAQQFYGVTPDLTILGKIVGGGVFPAGAFCGRREIMKLAGQMEYKHPSQRSFHGGTYAANPLTTRAGYVLLKELEKGEVYPYLRELGQKARKGLEEIFQRRGFEAYVTGEGSLVCTHFTKERPRDVLTAQRTKNRPLALAFFKHMLSHNILYLTADSPHFFISAAHSAADLDKFLSLTEEFAHKPPQVK